MLLRLLLIATALTPLTPVGSTFWSPTFQATGSDTLNPVASCAPTQPEEEEEEEDDEKPRRPTRGRFS